MTKLAKHKMKTAPRPTRYLIKTFRLTGCFMEMKSAAAKETTETKRKTNRFSKTTVVRIGRLSAPKEEKVSRKLGITKRTNMIDHTIETVNTAQYPMINRMLPTVDTVGARVMV